MNTKFIICINIIKFLLRRSFVLCPILFKAKAISGREDNIRVVEVQFSLVVKYPKAIVPQPASFKGPSFPRHDFIFVTVECFKVPLGLCPV